MAKILGFNADILSVKYISFENKSNYSDEPIIYMCETWIKEVGQGLAKANYCHNAKLQISKELFDDKALEKGDRIKILDKATWHPDKPVEFISRTKEKIKNADKSTLVTDENGFTVSKRTIYPYSIRCKETQWELVSKFYDLNYATIVNSGIKLPLKNNKQFAKSKELEFYLDPPEMTIIGPMKDEIVKVISYSNKNKIGEKNMQIKISIDKESGLNKLTLVEVKK